MPGARLWGGLTSISNSRFSIQRQDFRGVQLRAPYAFPEIVLAKGVS